VSAWRKNLALIIANKSPDWRAMAVALGDQLMKTEGEKVLHHMLCYVILCYIKS
jgi:hypothetical protein